MVNDIKLEENDLLIANGDFTVAESDQQHIEDIIFENVGAYKQFPLVGVGILNYLNSSGSEQGLRNEILSQLTVDGYSDITVTFDGDDLSNFDVNAIRN